LLKVYVLAEFKEFGGTVMKLSRRDFGRGVLGAAAVVAVAPQAIAKQGGVTAVDCHAHVFRVGLPLADVRRYAPDYDATPADYVKMLDANGMSHGVLIQPSFLGADNSYLIGALREYPKRLRGVAVVEPTVTRGELNAMNEAGVVGIRLNLIGKPDPVFGQDDWQALLRHVAELGWQVEIHVEAVRLPQITGPLLNAGVNIVVDHFGRPNPKLGVNDPHFGYLLSLGKTRRIWVKISAAYRNGKDEAGDRTAVDAMAPLRENFGLDRLLWGSDWPHTQFESQIKYAAMRAQLDSWLPNAADRKVVLAEAPKDLFRLG
jgi:predicted TIM-barrel fold metal-dependent hydrolase